MTVDRESVRWHHVSYPGSPIDKWHHVSYPGYLLDKWSYRGDQYVLEVCRYQRNPSYKWFLLTPTQLPLARPSLGDASVRLLRSGSAGSREDAMGLAVGAHRQWVTDTDNGTSAPERIS